MYIFWGATGHHYTLHVIYQYRSASQTRASSNLLKMSIHCVPTCCSSNAVYCWHNMNCVWWKSKFKKHWERKQWRSCVKTFLAGGVCEATGVTVYTTLPKHCPIKAVVMCPLPRHLTTPESSWVVSGAYRAVIVKPGMKKYYEMKNMKMRNRAYSKIGQNHMNSQKCWNSTIFLR